MSRTQRGPIDYLAGYTLIDYEGDPPHEDYYEQFGYTIWGIGLITFGSPTAAQQAWIADQSNWDDLSTFPTDWVSFGFPQINNFGPIEVWGTIRMAGVLFREQGIEGATAWSIGGLTGTGLFYYSDLSTINGTSAGEILPGTNNAETIFGGGGNDLLQGNGGSDALHGGAGNDHLVGGDGPDRLWGGDGNDLLEPGSDAAFVYVGPDPDAAGVYFVDGGAGFDTLKLDYSASAKSQVLVASQILDGPNVVNVEAVDITGSAFTDELTGTANADRLFGGGGFDVLRGGGGDDWLDAGAPGSSAVGDPPAGGYSLAGATSLDSLFTDGPDGSTVSFEVQQVEYSTLSWGARPIAGNIFSFTVESADQLAYIVYAPDATGGSAQIDFTVYDASGTIIPWFPWGPTNPIVFPHAGTYFFEVGIGNSNVWAPSAMYVTMTLAGHDVLTSNVLEGGTGNDTYAVYSATDQIVEKAGEGTDTVRSSVSWSLGANLENLTLTGAAAINGAGNALANVITGNSASNFLTGGAGADRFAFTEIGATDRILDFSGKGKGQGDKIDLSAIDANSNTAANEAFSLVNKFTGKAGQVTTSYDQGTGLTSVYLDVNGDKAPDMVIQLVGQPNLTSADFIF